MGNGISRAEMKGFEGEKGLDGVFLICELCGELIAEVDLPKLAFPLSGSMFKSPDPFHGFPNPFYPTDTWESCRCPYCHFRPILADNEIKTTEGVFDVADYAEKRGKIEEEEAPKPVFSTETDERLLNPVIQPFVKPLRADYVCMICGEAFYTQKKLAGHRIHCQAEKPKVKFKRNGMHEMSL